MKVKMRQRDFLEELFKQLRCRSEILDFLVSQKFIDSIAAQRILIQNHSTHAITILGLLNKLKEEDKLQLVDFEWTILPKLRMKLSLVGETDSKEWLFEQ
jgi:hypothetical protein